MSLLSSWRRNVGQTINGLSGGRKQRRKSSFRPLRLESLERRTVLTAGWVSQIGGEDEFVRDLAGDAAGNTYVAGVFSKPATFGDYTLTGDGVGDIFVAKLNANGQFLWAVKAGNPSSASILEDNMSGIAVDAAGGIFITGSFQGTAQFGTQSVTSAGGSDAFVAKLDGGSGQFLWVERRGGSGNDEGNAVAIDPSGNLILSGGFDLLDAPGKYSPAMFISKFTTDATELWTRTISGSTASGLLLSVAADAAGDIYAAGKLKGTADFLTATGMVTLSASPDHPDPLITKLDGAGNWLWARNLPATTRGVAQGTSIGPDGQLYVSGAFEGTVTFDSTTLTGAGNLDLFAARVNAATGSVEWARRFGGSDMETGGEIEVDPLGNINVVGGFRGTADFGPETLTAEGGVENAFVTTLHSSGTFLKSHRFLTVTSNIVVPVTGFHIDAAGNLYVGGWFSGGTVQFPTGPVHGAYGISYVVKLPHSAATKFYVVDDAFRDRTYQHAASGNLTIDHYSLNSSNTAPRGAASTVAGDKVWVVDANKKVYVYNTSGGLLGSWTAGSLASNATVEGIATNGTDVWIVDARQDRVYKYANAAGRLSGNQNAASSFSLNSGNRNPKDIVASSTNLWVVNDSTTDKVFKYTLAGALVGSWTITAGGGAPTGITLDPANVSNIWIVDNNTDRVYQFDAAAGRTSGSQAPSTSFALAAGNTNPQGIADPPAPSAGDSSSAYGTSASAPFDAALLAVLDELDGVLTGRKKRK